MGRRPAGRKNYTNKFSNFKHEGKKDLLLAKKQTNAKHAIRGTKA